MTDESMEAEQKESTFLVTAADDNSAVLKDVHDGQVHTLSSNPGVEVHDAVTGTVAPDPPMNVSWQLVEIERRWNIAIERNDESPTAHVKDLADQQATGDLHREERAGTGEIHVLTVPEELTEQAVDDVADDLETTLSRAARLGVDRVEIRWAPGVVSVRYMP
jgi:2,4-dienoyl-CoA reductase-like NADH-dependent reductase (Old Yellow Enzyme family)